MKDRSLIFPALMILLSTVALVLIGQFEAPMFQDASVDATFFPKVIAIGIIILSVLIIIQEKIKPSQKDKAPMFSKMAVFGVIFLIIYATLIHYLGYLIATLTAFTF
ncbi:MAG: tripartite tricarboxylate transporter TctB family protein, partial [Vibrio sp.]